MKKWLSWVLCATPLFYVGLMKATGQPVETAVLLMLLPFIAFPFVVGRFFPEDEEQAKADAIRVLKAAARGGSPERRPPQKKP